jgi:hypothetical protein
MVRVYYHIYAIEGVESIIEEQLELMKSFFDFPYVLNVGISIANQNTSIDNILEKFYNLNKINYRIRDVRAQGNEFVTLDLIEKDKETFGDSDYILYIHTKGASRIKQAAYPNYESWRKIMNYFNIEKCKNVFELFEKTQYNTYGILLCSIPSSRIYGGNFWWTKVKLLNRVPTNIKEMWGTLENRHMSEWCFLNKIENWNPGIVTPSFENFSNFYNYIKTESDVVLAKQYVARKPYWQNSEVLTIIKGDKTLTAKTTKSFI